MTTEGRELAQANAEASNRARFGFWTAVGTALSTVLAFGIAVLTPPLSGPFCTQNCFEYPYLEIAPRFPRDYQWMMAAVPATLLYAAWMVGLDARAHREKKLVAHLGVVASVMASLTLVGDYFVQLAVIQPSVLSGESDGISLLTQYNPHGVFIALEELGFLLMSLSFACMAGAMATTTRLERSIRWLFLAGFAATVVAFAWFLQKYGHARGYLFEVAVISINWFVLIAGALLTAVVFRRDIRSRV